MSETLSNPFASSAKKLVRRFDHDLISNFQERFYPKERLSYLGLPGEDLLDVIAWREFIGSWTAVQIANTPEFIESAVELELNVMRNNLERDFTLRLGNIDDLIGTKEGQDTLSFPYQIVNLDYVGGLVQARQDGTSKRIETIRALFEKQTDVAFMLFVTLNLKDKDQGEFERYLAAVESELIAAGSLNVKERIQAHKKQFGYAGLLKLYLPIFLGDNAKQHSLTIRPPILYQGSKQMLHFAIECVPYTRTAGGSMLSVTDKIGMINLPIFTSDKEDDLNEDSIGPLITSALDGLE